MLSILLATWPMVTDYSNWLFSASFPFNLVFVTVNTKYFMFEPKVS